MASRWENIFSSPLGRVVIGFIKIGLASTLIALVNALSNSVSSTITVGDVQVPVGVIFQIIIGFFPLLLLISAMRDLGIHI